MNTSNFIEEQSSYSRTPIPSATFLPTKKTITDLNKDCDFVECLPEIKQLWASHADSDIVNSNLDGVIGPPDGDECNDTYRSWYNHQLEFSPNEYFLELRFEYSLVPSEINLIISGNSGGYLRIEGMDSSSGLGIEIFDGTGDTLGKCPGKLTVPVQSELSVDKIILSFKSSDPPMFIDAVELVGTIPAFMDIPVFWRIPIPADSMVDPKSDFPGGLATDQYGNIFVANGTNGLYRYDVEGNLLQNYSVPNESNIRDVVIDNQGQIILTDLTYKWYVTLDQNGNQVDTGGEDFGWNGPREVAVHPKTGNIYLLDETDEYSRIRVYSSKNNSLIKDILLETIGLQMHKGLAFDQDGFLYTLDQIQAFILKLDAETGEVVNELGFMEMSKASPSDLTLDENGNIYVLLNASPENTAVYVFDSFGSLKHRLGKLTYDGEGWMEGVFFFPVGISISPDGRFLSIIENGYLTTYLLNE